MSDPVSKIFEDRLRELGFSFEIKEDNCYDVSFGEDQTSTVYLENKRKEFEKDPDPEIIFRFIDQVQRSNQLHNTTWEEAKPYLRFQLDGDHYQDFPDDVLFEPVAEGLIKIYVYTSPDGELITWIANHLIEKWQTDSDTIKQIAEQNMNTIVANTKLEIDEIDSVPLGMLSTEEGAFKASLVLASGFKDLVIDQLGFPVYAVTPDRDFVYLVPTKHTEFLGRIGSVVCREYDNSSYPISKEVFELSDEGLTIIGSFANQEK